MTAKGPRYAKFTGSIIAISNLPLTGHHKEVLAALRSRIYCVAYEPSDEQMIALIREIAGRGTRGLSPRECLQVATYLIEECKRREIRPEIRLFMDKALPDFRLWREERTETHWRDLVSSELEQQLVEIKHEQRDISKAEQIEAERRIARDIYHGFTEPKERVKQWRERTDKSQATLYRRWDELKEAGQLDEPVEQEGEEEDDE